MQVRTGTARSGDLEIYYEDMGDPNDPAVLLVMGLGAQILLWRKGFCEKLVNQGLRVIRYDNRDVGLSTKVDRPPHRRPAAAEDGPLVPRHAQPGGLHAGGHGRRRRRAARPSEASTRRTSSAPRWAA